MKGVSIRGVMDKSASTWWEVSRKMPVWFIPTAFSECMSDSAVLQVADLFVGFCLLPTHQQCQHSTVFCVLDRQAIWRFSIDSISWKAAYFWLWDGRK